MLGATLVCSGEEEVVDSLPDYPRLGLAGHLHVLHVCVSKGLSLHVQPTHIYYLIDRCIQLHVHTLSNFVIIIYSSMQCSAQIRSGDVDVAPMIWILNNCIEPIPRSNDEIQ